MVLRPFRKGIFAITTSFTLIQGKFTITPLNFLEYNSEASNLAEHGLHPRYLHFLVNFPLVFGPVAITSYYLFGRFLPILFQLFTSIGLLLVKRLASFPKKLALQMLDAKVNSVAPSILTYQYFLCQVKQVLGVL